MTIDLRPWQTSPGGVAAGGGVVPRDRRPVRVADIGIRRSAGADPGPGRGSRGGAREARGPACEPPLEIASAVEEIERQFTTLHNEVFGTLDQPSDQYSAGGRIGDPRTRDCFRGATPTPPRRTATPGLFDSAFNLRVEAEYRQIREMLAALQSSPEFLVVESLNLTGDEDPVIAGADDFGADCHLPGRGRRGTAAAADRRDLRCCGGQRWLTPKRRNERIRLVVFLTVLADCRCRRGCAVSRWWWNYRRRTGSSGLEYTAKNLPPLEIGEGGQQEVARAESGGNPFAFRAPPTPTPNLTPPPTPIPRPTMPPRPTPTPRIALALDGAAQTAAAALRPGVHRVSWATA